MGLPPSLPGVKLKVRVPSPPAATTLVGDDGVVRGVKATPVVADPAPAAFTART